MQGLRSKVAASSSAVTGGDSAVPLFEWLDPAQLSLLELHLVHSPSPLLPTARLISAACDLLASQRSHCLLYLLEIYASLFAMLVSPL